MTLTAPDRTAAIEAKLDALAEQVAAVAAEAREQRQRREAWDELRIDMTPLLGQALDTASRELEDVQEFVNAEDMMRLVKRLLRNTRRIEETLERFESALEFVDDARGLTKEAVCKAMNGLDSLEQRGYFGFARAGAGVVDKVVTAFSEEDVEALGDNVVTILHTVKEITQPEMLALLQHMIDALERQQEAIEEEPADPPGMWALLRKMRDPDVRRGINRALTTLGTVSAETGPEAMREIHKKEGAS